MFVLRAAGVSWRFLPQCLPVMRLKADLGAVFGLWLVRVVVAFGKLFGDLAFDQSGV